MGSSPNQDESIVLLVPDQQPVRFDVTFPAGRPVPGQPMLPMSWVERLIRQKSLHDTPELVEILAALSATLEILQAGVFGESLSAAGLPQRCDGLALGTFTANGKP